MRGFGMEMRLEKERSVKETSKIMLKNYLMRIAYDLKDEWSTDRHENRILT